MMTLRTPIRASQTQRLKISFKGPWSAEDRSTLYTALVTDRYPLSGLQTNSTWTFIVLEQALRPVYVATCATPIVETFSARTLSELLSQIRSRNT